MIEMPFVPGFYGCCQQLEDANAGTNPPGQVTGLAVAAASTTQLNLTWDSTANANSYKVERATSSGGSFSQISTPSSNSYNDTGRSAGTAYYYKVRATNGNGDGSYSSEATSFTLPNQVTGLTASAVSASQINLTWSNPTGTETGYKIMRASSSGGSFSQIATSASTNYNNTGLSTSTAYYYKVKGYTSPGGDGALSSEATATTTTGPPGQVTGLAVAAASTTQLNLSWSATTNATSYKVERSVSSGSGFSQIATPSSNSHNDTGRSVGTRYYYKVRATNGDGDGSYSSEANSFTLPGQVTGLSASAVSTSQINLSWNNPTGTETGFKILRATSSGGTYSQITTVSGTTSYSNTGLSASTTYYYKVKAYTSPGGDGAESSIANATTNSAGSAPTGVSIATTSSGNYDNAVIVDCISGPGVVASNNGSTFSSNLGDVVLNYSPSYNNALLANGGVIDFVAYGYIRATGATSFSWDMRNPNIVQDTNGAVSSVGLSGTPSTSQNCTVSHIQEVLRVTHNSGGRGYLLLNTTGDGVGFRVDAEATNATGTTAAVSVNVTITV